MIVGCSGTADDALCHIPILQTFPQDPREAGIPTEALDAVVLLVGCAAPIRQITCSLLSVLQGSRQLSWQGLVLAAFHNWLTLFFLEREEKRERKKNQSLTAFAIQYTIF